MAAEDSSQVDATSQALAELARLRAFSGPPAEFWPAYLQACARLGGAAAGVLLVKGAGPEATWRRLGQWSAVSGTDPTVAVFTRQLASVADRCALQEAVAVPLESVMAGGEQPMAVAVTIPLPRASETCVAAFFLAQAGGAAAREILLRLRLVADVPASFQLSHQSAQSRTDVEKFASTLDVMTQVNAEKRFLAAAMALCNAVASRHRCERVSLGWLEHGYIRVQAISRTERFDRSMAAVKALETAMEESYDQDEEVVWPVPDGVTTIARDHAAYSKAEGAKHLASVPLRLDGDVAGVVLCEREDEPFGEVELRQLRLVADQAGRRLSELKRHDRWWGGRVAAGLREKAAKWVGVDHTWAKVIAVLASVTLLALLLIQVDYRVEAKFLVHSDEVAFLTSPFEGFIEEVPVRVSDPVVKDQAMLVLSRDQLELEESVSIADLARYTREGEKARAQNALADMRIALALADQARARLDLVRYRLEQSSIKAPFEGVVVEGDHRERIGAPAKQGEVSFKVARTDRLYLEADVNERDVHEVRAGAAGEVAFASQPKLKYPVKVERVRAAGQPKENENVFVTRCAFAGGAERWWRPGMSGVCKIEAGRRSLVWILTHRTVDYLRLLFWW